MPAIRVSAVPVRVFQSPVHRRAMLMPNLLTCSNSDCSGHSTSTSYPGLAIMPDGWNDRVVSVICEG